MLKKDILVFSLILVFLIGVIFLTNSLSQKPTRVKTRATVSETTLPSLTIIPSEQTVSAGDLFNVDVYLSTGGQKARAAGAVVTFDPTVLEADPLGLSTGNLPGGVYPGKSFDNNLGRVILSWVAYSKEGGKEELFSGTNLLGRIKFKAKKMTSSTKTVVAFDFTAGRTDDSNIIESANGQDILTKTSAGYVTILPK